VISIARAIGVLVVGVLLMLMSGCCVLCAWVSWPFQTARNACAGLLRELAPSRAAGRRA
jgi:hypothetical protein